MEPLEKRSTSADRSAAGPSPRMPAIDRLTHLLAQASLKEATTISVDRLVTPAGALVVEGRSQNRILDLQTNLAVTVHSDGEGDHALLLVNGRVEAATASALGKLKGGKRSALVKFDAESVDHEGKDFKVQARDPTVKTRKGGDAPFYSVCHLIDFKYSYEADGDPDNFFPGRNKYNHPLKECLVKSSEAYLEVPVYTPHPPTLKGRVTRQGWFEFPIPICVLLIRTQRISQTIKKHTVEWTEKSAYCFPNNLYSYPFKSEGVEHFRLKDTLLPLLLPAVINEVRSKQRMNEELVATMLEGLLEDIYQSYGETGGDMTTLADQVFHGDVHPGSLYQTKRIVDDRHVKEVAGFFAPWLLQHAMNNLLKREVLSTDCHLTFLKTLVSFVEQFEISGESASKYTVFRPILRDTWLRLYKLNEVLSVDELLSIGLTIKEFSSARSFEYVGEKHAFLTVKMLYSSFKVAVEILWKLHQRKPATFTEEQLIDFLRLAKKIGATHHRLDPNDLDRFARQEALFFEMGKPCFELLLRIAPRLAAKWRIKIAHLQGIYL